MIIKVEGETFDDEVISKLRLYEREIHFFETLSGDVSKIIKCPRYYSTVESSGKKIAIIIEDIGTSNLFVEINNEKIFRIVDDLAKFHNNFFKKR